jgi:hypothetical protein
MSLKFAKVTPEVYDASVDEINSLLGGNHKIFGSTESYEKAFKHLFFSTSGIQRPIQESLKILRACNTFATKPREFLILGTSKIGSKGTAIKEDILKIMPLLTEDEFKKGLESAAAKGDNMIGVRKGFGAFSHLNFTLMNHISFLTWQYCDPSCSTTIEELKALYNGKLPSQITEDNFIMCKDGRGGAEKVAMTRDIALRKILYFNSQAMFHAKYATTLMEFSMALGESRRY